MTIQSSNADAVAALKKPRRNFGFLFALTLLGLLVALWVFLAFATPTFATANNISNLLRQGSMIAILAIGQTFVIITAGIDLSVGAVVGFSTTVIAYLLQAGFPVWLSVILTLVMGLAIGLFHGFGIVKMGLPPFIITLATLTALRGIGLVITNGSTISITDPAFNEFSRNSFLGIPNLFWMVIVVAVPAFVFLHRSRLRPLPLRGRLQPGAARACPASTSRAPSTWPIRCRRSARPSSACCSPPASASATRRRPRAGSFRRSLRRSSAAPVSSAPWARSMVR